MALIKEKTNEQGVTYNYWVAQRKEDALNKRTGIEMLGFISKESRESGKVFIEKVKINNVTDGNYLTGEQIYTFAKTQDFFTDAVDDN